MLMLSRLVFQGYLLVVKDLLRLHPLSYSKDLLGETVLE